MKTFISIRAPRRAAVSLPARRFIFVAAGIAMGSMAVTKLPANTYPITAQDQAAVPYVQGVPSETARFLQDLHGMGVAAVALDGVQKPYLNGTGTIVAFSNDNIQVFEFPAAQIASEAAAQIFKKAPRLKREPDFFHVFTEGKLVVLYFGHNQDVIAVTRQVVAR